jgi:hypothetical protein
MDTKMKEKTPRPPHNYAQDNKTAEKRTERKRMLKVGNLMNKISQNIHIQMMKRKSFLTTEDVLPKTES